MTTEIWNQNVWFSTYFLAIFLCVNVFGVCVFYSKMSNSIQFKPSFSLGCLKLKFQQKKNIMNFHHSILCKMTMWNDDDDEEEKKFDNFSCPPFKSSLTHNHSVFFSFMVMKCDRFSMCFSLLTKMKKNHFKMWCYINVHL